MMKYFFFIFCFALLFACNKDKFETKPTLTIKSYNFKELPRNQPLVVTLEYTDKQGDLGGGTVVYSPKRLNRRPLPSNIPNYQDSTGVTIPVYANEPKAEVDVRIPYNTLHRSDTENDTIVVRFYFIDKAKNRSDTVTTDQLVILRN